MTNEFRESQTDPGAQLCNIPTSISVAASSILPFSYTVPSHQSPWQIKRLDPRSKGYSLLVTTRYSSPSSFGVDSPATLPSCLLQIGYCTLRPAIALALSQQSCKISPFALCPSISEFNRRLSMFLLSFRIARRISNGSVASPGSVSGGWLGIQDFRSSGGCSVGLSAAHTSGKGSTLGPDDLHGHAADGCSRLLREHPLAITCVGHAQGIGYRSL